MLFVQHSICIASCCQCPAGKGIAGTQILLTDNKSLPQNTMLEELKPAHLVHVPSSAIEVPVKCHRHPVESQPAPQSCAPEKLSVLGSCLQRLGWTPLNSPVKQSEKDKHPHQSKPYWCFLPARRNVHFQSLRQDRYSTIQDADYIKDQSGAIALRHPPSLGLPVHQDGASHRFTE